MSCPAGFYCKLETGHKHSYPCPIGKYGLDVGGKSSVLDCVDCPEEFYCPRKGMTESEKNDYPCKDGYICNAGSSEEEGSELCPID